MNRIFEIYNPHKTSHIASFPSDAETAEYLRAQESDIDMATIIVMVSASGDMPDKVMLAPEWLLLHTLADRKPVKTNDLWNS